MHSDIAREFLVLACDLIKISLVIEAKSESSWENLLAVAFHVTAMTLAGGLGLTDRDWS